MNGVLRRLVSAGQQRWWQKGFSGSECSPPRFRATTSSMVETKTTSAEGTPLSKPVGGLQACCQPLNGQARQVQLGVSSRSASNTSSSWQRQLRHRQLRHSGSAQPTQRTARRLPSAPCRRRPAPTPLGLATSRPTPPSGETQQAVVAGPGSRMARAGQHGLDTVPARLLRPASPALTLGTASALRSQYGAARMQWMWTRSCRSTRCACLPHKLASKQAAAARPF